MADPVSMALEVTRELRRSGGYRQLDAAARRALDADLARIESRLTRDPYAQVLDVGLLQDKLRQSSGGQQPAAGGAGRGQPAPQTPPAPPPPPQTAVIGQRAADVLQAVNFPGFVASLLTGTFQAIVDASAQQVREYARLVASITQTLEEFSDENVSPNQSRDHLAQQYPGDLMVVFPAPGAPGQPRLVPRPERAGESPAWLEKYKLGGEGLTEELTEGPLLDAGRRSVGEDRLQTLATMVLMGINRVVVNEGDLRAKLQFHATAIDSQKAEFQTQGATVAARTVGDQSTQMMVSTLKANAQADASIKTDLMGEVRISFRSETFPLERFADSAAIQLLNQHARWRGDGGPPAAGAGAVTAAAPTATAPAPSPAPAAAPAPAAPPAAGAPEVPR